jgi:hypothetical protein
MLKINDSHYILGEASNKLSQQISLPDKGREKKIRNKMKELEFT